MLACSSYHLCSLWGWLGTLWDLRTLPVLQLKNPLQKSHSSARWPSGKRQVKVPTPSHLSLEHYPMGHVVEGEDWLLRVVPCLSHLLPAITKLLMFLKQYFKDSTIKAAWQNSTPRCVDGAGVTQSEVCAGHSQGPSGMQVYWLNISQRWEQKAVETRRQQLPRSERASGTVGSWDICVGHGDQTVKQCTGQVSMNEVLYSITIITLFGQTCVLETNS